MGHTFKFYHKRRQIKRPTAYEFTQNATHTFKIDDSVLLLNNVESMNTL